MNNLRFFTTKPRNSIINLFKYGEIVCKQTDELSGVIKDVLGFEGFIWAYATNTNESKIYSFSGKFIIEFKRPTEFYTLDKVIKHFVKGLDGKWYKKDLDKEFRKEDFIFENTVQTSVIILPKLRLDDIISISQIPNGIDIDTDKQVKKNLNTFKNINGRDWTVGEIR